jgi:DNA-binding NarL/FixJ family response regulator
MSVDVLVAVRHPIMRRGVVCLLADSAKVRVVGDAGNIESLSDKFLATSPDVVLLDRTLMRLDSRATIRGLAEKSPGVRFIQLSPYEKSGGDCANHDLLLGDPEPLIEAIVGDADNSGFDLVGWPSAMGCDPLTAREHEVLLLAAEGYTSSQIARRLSISPRTVELHRFRMCRKLGLHSPLDLAKYVIRQGLVPI